MLFKVTQNYISDAPHQYTKSIIKSSVVARKAYNLNAIPSLNHASYQV